MLNFNLKLSKTQQNDLVKKLRKAEAKGDIREAKRIMAILALDEGHSKNAASTLHVTVEAIQHWVKRFLLNGLRGLQSKKSPGRPSKLNKSQRRELSKIIEDGPEKAGYVGNCWRSPIIQALIFEKFDIFYSVHYISALLKNMGSPIRKQNLSLIRMALT